MDPLRLRSVDGVCKDKRTFSPGRAFSGGALGLVGLPGKDTLPGGVQGRDQVLGSLRSNRVRKNWVIEDLPVLKTRQGSGEEKRWIEL